MTSFDFGVCFEHSCLFQLPGEWHELHINELPRFSYARQVRMNLIEDAEEGSKLAESSECKMFASDVWVSLHLIHSLCTYNLRTGS
jgi:hypothetical protein